MKTKNNIFVFTKDEFLERPYVKDDENTVAIWKSVSLYFK